jgi:hypothetical protein
MQVWVVSMCLRKPAVDKRMHLLGYNEDRIDSYLGSEIGFDEILVFGSVLVIAGQSLCLCLTVCIYVYLLVYMKLKLHMVSFLRKKVVHAKW